MTTTIRIHLDGDGCWPDLIDRQSEIIHVGDGSVIDIAALDAGMTSGRMSVALRIDLPDGRPLIAETSWRSLATAVQAIAARHGWPE
jgi:hypothetical protein